MTFGKIFEVGNVCPEGTFRRFLSSTLGSIEDWKIPPDPIEHFYSDIILASATSSNLREYFEWLKCVLPFEEDMNKWAVPIRGILKTKIAAIQIVF